MSLSFSIKRACLANQAPDVPKNLTFRFIFLFLYSGRILGPLAGYWAPYRGLLNRYFFKAYSTNVNDISTVYCQVNQLLPLKNTGLKCVGKKSYKSQNLKWPDTGHHTVLGHCFLVINKHYSARNVVSSVLTFVNAGEVCHLCTVTGQLIQLEGSSF